LFEKYAKEYEALTLKMIEQLKYLDINESDPVKYGFMVKDIICKWRVVGSLLGGIKQDASKKQ
jgi:hypothetical protein